VAEVVEDKASSTKVWRTSVTELMLLFRDALVAIAPILDQAHIKWRIHESYDQWDEIANTLFEQIVGDSLHFALVETPLNGIHEPPLRLKKYTMSDLGEDRIVVRSLDNAEVGDLTFRSFVADSPHFSEVSAFSEARGVDATRLPSDRVEFALFRELPDGSTQRITVLIVDDN
jgi:hypothetical protein